MDVAHDRDIVARWCNLAEQRLEYLTELFETGRWRRYHSELAFLENIQEAKTAVETWRGLSMREASFDNSAIDMSWLGRSKAPPPCRETVPDQAASPRPLKILGEPSPSSAPALVASDLVCSDDAPSVAAMEHTPEPALDIAAIEQRYPLLRNAL
ncbi:TIGR03809 family protein [Bradyrhizobium sediminis]|uniref:TIGR03809 family protein n=1 Tax=Bradyrhizobium sediminis TaxID=2840469 RepID=UPI00352C1A7A